MKMLLNLDCVLRCAILDLGQLSAVKNRCIPRCESNDIIKRSQLQNVSFFSSTDHRASSLLESFPTNSFQASLVAQIIRNLLAMQETRVQSLDREDPLEIP